MEFTKEIIDELFKNEYFQEKLNAYIVENLTIRQDYDSYAGKYDGLQISFGDNPIEIQSKSYGY